MPIICIGPVCVPITAIIPILLFVFQPIYVRLPTSYQRKIDDGIKRLQLALNRCLRRIGWNNAQKKKKKKDDDYRDMDDRDDLDDNEENVTHPDRASSSKSNETENSANDSMIKDLLIEEDWNALMQESKTNHTAFIAYFTSSWCKPCKAFYPHFVDLCRKSQINMQYIKVDIDEFDEIALEHKVNTLPTFIKFKNGQQDGFVSGPDQEALAQLFQN